MTRGSKVERGDQRGDQLSKKGVSKVERGDQRGDQLSKKGGPKVERGDQRGDQLSKKGIQKSNVVINSVCCALGSHASE